MLDTGYPDPQDAYFGIPLGEEIHVVELDGSKIRQLALSRARDEFGPAVVSLLDILQLQAGAKV